MCDLLDYGHRQRLRRHEDQWFDRSLTEARRVLGEIPLVNDELHGQRLWIPIPQTHKDVAQQLFAELSQQFVRYSDALLARIPQVVPIRPMRMRPELCIQDSLQLWSGLASRNERMDHRDEFHFTLLLEIGHMLDSASRSDQVSDLPGGAVPVVRRRRVVNREMLAMLVKYMQQRVPVMRRIADNRIRMWHDSRAESALADRGCQ